MLIGIREIEEKYDILAKLGEGGMGSVYKARHKLLDELRVIKTIKPQLRSDSDLQNRFLREAQVAAKMSHPNIATLHDFAFTGDGTAYIVMQHVDGHNLREYQRQGGKLSVEDVVEIGCQSLDALGYLHSKSFVHRDISTDNLMIGWPTERPHVTLIDLGLAKSLEGSDWRTKTGMVVGKVRYISPEQLNSGVSGVEVDARSDLYSFGVVLYELLTGEYPITGADDMSLIAGHLYRPPRPFEETDPDSSIPTGLRTVVMKALEKKPEYRYAAAADFAAALRAAESGEPSAPWPEAGMNGLEDATTALSPEQLAGSWPEGKGAADPFRATETIGVQVDPQVTRPAMAPGDAPFTRPAVPVGDAGAAGTQPAGLPTRPVSEAAAAEAVRPLERSGAPHATVEVDHEARTTRLEMPSGVPASAPTELDIRDSIAGAGESDGAASLEGPAQPGEEAIAAASRPAVPRSGARGRFLALAVAGLVVAAAVWLLAGRWSSPPIDTAVVTETPSADGSGGAEARSGAVFWGDYHAVVIGNNEYQRLPPLDSAVRDARAVARLLEKKYAFRVQLLENADNATIRNAIWDMGEGLTSRDNLLIYYAGHGAVAERSPYWQAVDAVPDQMSRWISTRHDVAGSFKHMAARHILVVSDSCFAGALGSDAPPLEPSLAGVPAGDRVRELVRRPSRLVLASGGLAPVLDTGSDGHSIFARAFLDVLDTNEGPLGVEALYQALAPRVEAAARQLDFEQKPVLVPIPRSDDEGGELFFVPESSRDTSSGP
ncbi:MAG: protein kinase [Holophagales bacterium]|nr:protein kinase [Holophagales bacterium]